MHKITDKIKIHEHKTVNGYVSFAFGIMFPVIGQYIWIILKAIKSELVLWHST